MKKNLILFIQHNKILDIKWFREFFCLVLIKRVRMYSGPVLKTEAEKRYANLFTNLKQIQNKNWNKKILCTVIAL